MKNKKDNNNKLMGQVDTKPAVGRCKNVRDTLSGRRATKSRRYRTES